MDPIAALKALLQALEADDGEAVRAHAEALAEWERAGGWRPGLTPSDYRKLFTELARIAEEYMP